MKLGENIKIGIAELLSYKFRSFLTMLGVIFGVAAVIAIVSIGEGARIEIMQQISLLGLNNIRIKPIELHGQELVVAKQKNPDGLSLKDVSAIRQNCPYIKGIVPIIIAKEKPRYGSKIINAQVIATEQSYPVIFRFYPDKGRFINEEDMKNSSLICVIGSNIANELFPNNDALKKQITIGDRIFSIVGVMEKKEVLTGEKSVISIRDINRDIYIPLSVAMQRLEPADENNELSEISIMIDHADNIARASDLIKRILLRTHNEVENFELVIPLALLKQKQETQRIFNIVMGAIAGISLLVGGIGIMNIMMATVIQRTREIGIRISLGGTQRDILGQFLIEALILSLTGGIFGIILGIQLGNIISAYAQWKTVFSIKAVIIAFTVSASTGIIFGIYPAWKASKLNPIEALRYE